MLTWLETLFGRTINEFIGPVLPSSHLFVLYLGSALVISMATYFWFSRAEASVRPEGVKKGMFGYIFDPSIWLHKSARQDYVFFVTNSLIYYGIVAHFLISSHMVFEAIGRGLNAYWGVRAVPLFEPSVASTLVFTFVSVLAIDFTIFITHYIQHKVAALWHFHAVHHSAEVLTVMTVSRQHPVDLFITGTVMVVLTQTVFASFSYLTLAEPSQFAVMNVNTILFAFFVVGYNLRHSHIWLSYPPWLSYIFISPAQHQTHHSVDDKHFDKNFGFIFAIWDWMFGTLYVPRGYEKLEYGLSREEPNPFASVREIYLKPFRLFWGEIKSIAKPRLSTRTAKPDRSQDVTERISKQG
ncbi:MAG: sterol desaturase family protein [Silicimonas sp.]|nr:sterol desaturase family protein [Silicimonas sp.]